MRELISCTKGFPVTWNDKTTVLDDTFTRGVYEVNILPNYKFELMHYDNNCNIVHQKYKGVWLISDNGYLCWSTTVQPFKGSSSFTHLLFSEWIEI